MLFGAIIVALAMIGVKPIACTQNLAATLSVVLQSKTGMDDTRYVCVPAAHERQHGQFDLRIQRTVTSFLIAKEANSTDKGVAKWSPN